MPPRQDAAAAAQPAAEKEEQQQQQESSQAAAGAAPAAQQQRPRRPPQRQQQQHFPAVAPSTVVNLAVHSLLMLAVPFGLFFATLHGSFDGVLALGSGGNATPPSREARQYLGAGLAVLGVNLVIASFVVAAFREQVPGDSVSGGAAATKKRE